MRRFLVTFITITLLPLLSWSSVNAEGPPTFTVNSQTVTGVTITDTTSWDAFTDVVGSTNFSATLLGSIDAVNPPNTEALTYTKMKAGAYGTMFLGGTDFAYVVDSDAINRLGASASVSDAFSFDMDGNASTTDDTAAFTVSLVGGDDIPTIGTAVPDFTEGVEAADVSTSSSLRQVPPSEQPIKAFDDSTATKYLNLDKAGSDLIVDVGTQYVLTALGLTTGVPRSLMLVKPSARNSRCSLSRLAIVRASIAAISIACSVHSARANSSITLSKNGQSQSSSGTCAGGLICRVLPCIMRTAAVVLSIRCLRGIINSKRNRV